MISRGPWSIRISGVIDARIHDLKFLRKWHKMNPQVSSLWLFMFTLSEETFKLTSSRLCRQSSELSAHSSCLMLPQMSETAQAAPAPACCPHVGAGVLRYRGHWVGVMCNGDLWGLGTRKWAQCGATTMLWSERELGTCRAEHDTVTKCERASIIQHWEWCVVCPWSFPGDQINGGGGMGLDTMN